LLRSFLADALPILTCCLQYGHGMINGPKIFCLCLGPITSAPFFRRPSMDNITTLTKSVDTTRTPSVNEPVPDVTCLAAPAVAVTVFIVPSIMSPPSSPISSISGWLKVVQPLTKMVQSIKRNEHNLKK